MVDILCETPDRFLLLPIRDEQAWKYYQDAVACFWTAQELDLTHDRYEELQDGQKTVLNNVLAFFATADGIVGENLATNFIPQVQCAEMRAFYSFQCAIETVHAQVYGELIQTYVPESSEQSELFHALERNPGVKSLGDWALHWTYPSRASFGERLVAFACVEGILFSAPFCVIFWFKQLGLLPGLCKANEFIARDEAQHMSFACFLFRDRLLPEQRPSTARVHEIVKQCVDVEYQFIEAALPTGLQGLNAHSMSQYVRYVADVMLTMMGLPKLYDERNPYSWMSMLGLGGKQNFFEGRVSEYKRANVSGNEMFQIQDVEF